MIDKEASRQALGLFEIADTMTSNVSSLPVLHRHLLCLRELTLAGSKDGFARKLFLAYIESVSRRFAQSVSIEDVDRDYKFLLADDHDLAAARAIEKTKTLLKSYIKPLVGRMVTVTSENFDEELYLASNWDVASVVSKGYLSSGLEHFQLWGAAEGRTMRFYAGV